MKPDTFITERLVLRRPALTDSLSVYEYASDSEVTRFMNWPTHQNARDTLNFLRRYTASWEDGTELTWAVTVKPHDHAIGMVSCRIQAHAASMGFVLNRRYWGQWYATEQQ
jgi:ribosomal-protein-alanine N-acetyltransferase